MASAMRKMAVYLGLVEDDRRFQDGYDSYEEYDEYDEAAELVEPVASVAARADYGGYVSDHRVEPVPPQQVRSSSPGSRHFIRALTMKRGPSVSTFAKAPR